MEDIKIISGASEQEIWQAIVADLSADEDVLNYEVLINQNGRPVQLTIDIDPGGGFEGGFETTELKAPLLTASDFRFAIHNEDFIDEIGKFFGMQDIQTGYTDLDKHIVIKTNDEEKVHAVFADAEVRQLFTTLEDFDMGIHTRHIDGTDTDQPVLELNINQGITDPASLQAIYHVFYKVLQQLEYAG